jgi:hypothetical protein
MESIGGPERDRAKRGDPDDVVTDDSREMPPEPAPSPGEADRARLGEEDVSEQAP